MKRVSLSLTVLYVLGFVAHLVISLILSSDILYRLFFWNILFGIVGSSFLYKFKADLYFKIGFVLFIFASLSFLVNIVVFAEFVMKSAMVFLFYATTLFVVKKKP